MLKCRKCAAHNVEIAVRGHARTCPYRLCPCEKCVKVVNKRLSSVKRRYKNSDVIFVNVECNSGNVRVQAIPKTLIDTLKSGNIGSSSTQLSPSVSHEMSSTKEPTPLLEEKTNPPSTEPSFVQNFTQLLPYFRMSPQQQLNLLSTYAWIMQSTQYLEEASLPRS